MRVNVVCGGYVFCGGGGCGCGGVCFVVKVEVFDFDYDFVIVNVKFNKQDFVCEVIVGGLLIVEVFVLEVVVFEVFVESIEVVEFVYNKQWLFFDNIFSDLKDRENVFQKLGGCEWCGEEQRKNIEIFG